MSNYISSVSLSIQMWNVRWQVLVLQKGKKNKKTTIELFSLLIYRNPKAAVGRLVIKRDSSPISVMLKVCLSSSYSALTVAAPISMRKCEFRAQYNIGAWKIAIFIKLIEQNSLNWTENYICFCISYKMAEENSRWRFRLYSALWNDCIIPRGTFLFHLVLHWTTESYWESSVARLYHIAPPEELSKSNWRAPGINHVNFQWQFVVTIIHSFTHVISLLSTD